MCVCPWEPAQRLALSSGANTTGNGRTSTPCGGQEPGRALVQLPPPTNGEKETQALTPFSSGV